MLAERCGWQDMLDAYRDSLRAWRGLIAERWEELHAHRGAGVVGFEGVGRAAVSTLEGIVAKITEGIKDLLSSVASGASTPSDQPDERWYRAAPPPLDCHGDSDRLRQWFSQPDLASIPCRELRFALLFPRIRL